MQFKNLLTSALGAGILGLGLGASQAQVANYAGPVSGGEWNTAANWDVLVPPGAGTNAVIPVGTSVNYNLPMAAATFATLTNQGILNVNAMGFNDTGIVMITTNSRLFLNNGAAVNVTGVMGISSNAACSMAPGSALTVSGTLFIGADTSGANGGAGTIGDIGSLTNNGGALTVGGVNLNPRNQSINQSCRLVISGGTNNLGNYVANRSPGGNSAPPALGTDGLIVSNGFVNTTAITIGNNAHGAMYLVGGTVTNAGSLTLKNSTATRPARFVQVGGLFVDPDPNLILMNPAGAADTVYAVLGGTNIVGGIQFGGATAIFTNGGTMYLGSQGMTSNGTPAVTAVLNNGGLLGATAPWIGAVALKLGGGMCTIQTADANNSAQNITLSGIISGTGGMNVTGSGVLTLGAINTYSGNTAISGGSLVLTAGSALASSRIIVGSGTTFDVSQVSGFTLGGAQTLAGSGTVTGAVIAPAGATVFPGSNSVTGTLTLLNGLTENGGVNNQFNLSGNPTGPGNDFLNVSGGLVLSGNNTVVINGALATGGAYPLIGYNGNITGGIGNLTASGATGIFSNSVANSIIYFIPQTSIRAATNITWIGNPTANNWDTELTTNWLNNGTLALDYFVPGDIALFSNLGATNPVINIPLNVSPGAIIVNTTSNYTLLGNGGVGGSSSVTVSNGTFNVLTTNAYTGPTIFDGGVLMTPLVANSGSPSGLGAASADPANVVFNGGTLAYDGISASTDHGITLTNVGGTFDVTNGSTLTLNGTLGGNGGLTLVDSGTLTLTAANVYGGNTTISNGTLNLNNAMGASAGTINLAGGTLGFVLSGQPTYLNNLTVSANSTIVSAGGNNNIITGTVLGNSNVTLNVSIGGTGTFSVGGNGGNGDMTNFFGTIELGNSTGTFRFNSAGGNSQFGAQNATIDLGTNSAIVQARNAGTMVIGALEGGTNTTLKGQGSGTGTLIWQIGSNTNNPSTTFFGTIAPGAAANDICSITKIGTGTLSLAGQSTYSGTTTVSTGTLALTNNPFTGTDGSINSSATINILAGATLKVTGRSDGALQLGAGPAQLLEGTGTLQGNLVGNGPGIVSAGGGPAGSTYGTLTVNGNVSLGGTTLFKVNRNNGSPLSDRLATLGTMTYGGTLMLTNVGAPFQVGDTFTLFSNSSPPSGAFNLALPDYYTWDTSHLSANGTVTVTAIFHPALSGVDFSQLAANGVIFVNATNGQPGALVNILTSTNIGLPFNQWDLNTQSSFDGNGNLNTPIQVDQTQPQMFLLLQGL